MTRRITTNEGGDYVDAQTGETLGAAEKADYEGHRVGEQADRLVLIVDNPQGGRGEQSLRYEIPSQSARNA